MIVAAVLFTMTALGGAVVASFPLRGIPRPSTWLALAHGAIGIAGFCALAYTAASRSITSLEQMASAALGLAAAGGLTLFFGFHLRGKPLPLLLVMGHGILAVAALALLWLSVYQQR